MIVDQHGRVAERLRISLTDRCDLRCSYCMPLTGTKFAPREELLTDEEICRVARFLVERVGLRHIRLTGGEPLLRPGIVDLVGELASTGINDLAMTTNAQLLAGKAAELKGAGLSRVNVSLDTLRADRFQAMARAGDLQRTLDGIDAAIEAGLQPIKINTVLMRGENDDELFDIIHYCTGRGIEVRFLELMAIGQSASAHKERCVQTAETIERLEEKYTLTPHHFVPGETSRSYSLSNGDGTIHPIGFISPVSHSFCNSCRRLRLSPTGMLRGCLMNGDGPNLRSILRSGTDGWEDELERVTLHAFQQKPYLSEMTTDVNMNSLGG